MPNIPDVSSAPSGISKRGGSVIRRVALLWVAFPFLLCASLELPAAGHGRSVSYSTWEIDPDGADVSVRLQLLELSRRGPESLPPGSVPGLRPSDAADLAAALFPRELILVADGQPCTPDPVAERRADEPGWVRYRWRIDCPHEARTHAIRSHVLLDVAPSHLHFARVQWKGAPEVIREKVLTEAAPEFALPRTREDLAGGAFGSDFASYLELGVRHILTGWDHLAFLFGLLLLASRFGEVARLVTGFTVAHSLTLALAVLDLAHPNAAAVEAVIAFSVALVAIEKGWRTSGRGRTVPAVVLLALGALAITSIWGWSSLPLVTIAGLLVFTACYFRIAQLSQSQWIRVCLTFAFGLVHGFGFAGVLLEMTLPTDRLVPALLGFNVGVEIGQLGAVLILWPLLLVGRRIATGRQAWLATELSTAALCGLGIYWLVVRAFPL
jgi:hypothetical protein